MSNNLVVKMSEGSYPILDNDIYYCIDETTKNEIIETSKQVKPEWQSICLTGDNGLPKIDESMISCIDENYGLYSIKTIPETSEDNINDDTIFVDFTEIHVSQNYFYIRMETADTILTSMSIPINWM